MPRKSTRAPSAASENAGRYASALDALIEQIKRDETVLSTILCGSLSHDVVWERSDIDLVLITADGKKLDHEEWTLDASGITVHAYLLPRERFRKLVESSIHHSLMHSLLSKGRVLYTHDPTITDHFAKLRDLGQRDAQVQVMNSAVAAVLSVDKAWKWLITRNDVTYSALYVLAAATPLAKMEVIQHGLLADREVMVNAMKLRPALFKIIYADLLHKPTTEKSLRRALSVIDKHLAQQSPKVFAPLLEHLRDVGEARSCSEIDDHFQRHFDLTRVSLVCDYVSRLGLISRVSLPVKITRKSNVQVQEVSYVFLSDELPGGDAHGA